MATKAVQRHQGAVNRIEAMRHPIRAAALAHLNVHGIASPQEIANAIGEDVTVVSYHVRRLVELDCAELVREEHVRGVVKHYYSPVQPHVLEAEEFAELPEEVRRSNVVEVVELQLNDYRTALKDGGIGSNENCSFVRLPLRGIDREGEREVVEILETAYRELRDVPARCHERIKESGEESIRVSVSLNAFEVSSF